MHEILNRYRPVEILHPIVSKIYDTPELGRNFWECLTHDLQVISSRSQRLADGEITSAQKAFKILMDDTEYGLAAIKLYVDEILGLETVIMADREETLATVLKTRDYILNRMIVLVLCRYSFWTDTDDSLCRIIQ